MFGGNVKIQTMLGPKTEKKKKVKRCQLHITRDRPIKKKGVCGAGAARNSFEITQKQVKGKSIVIIKVPM